MKPRIAAIWLGVGEPEVDVAGGRGRLDGCGVRQAPRALRTYLAEAEHDALLFSLGRTRRERGDEEDGDEQSRQRHPGSLLGPRS
jgi:hypothetical protein